MSRIIHKLKMAASIYPKLIKYKWFKKPTPLLVGFGITNRCNLSCKYCFATLKNRKQKDVPTEKMLDYIDQFIELGAEEIDLQGGEPTMHPDLGIIINHIVSRGAECSMATNGFNVAGHIEDLKKCYVVCVSLDGTSETTNFHRGKNAYEIAVKALELMNNHGINTRLHGVLTYKTSQNDIDHLIMLAKKYKTSVNFVYALESGDSSTGCSDEVGFPEHVRNLARYLSECKQKGDPITSKEGAIQQVINWPFGSQDILLEDEMNDEQVKKLNNTNIPRCYWGHLACFYNPDGNLYRCPRGYDREGYFTTIGDRSIKDAYNELAESKNCYMCGQMGDLSYSFNFGLDNLKTWLKF